MLPLDKDDLRDALDQLSEWVCEAHEIRRVMRLDEAGHAALTERIKVVADAFQIRPEVRRLDGHTQIRVRPANGQRFTDSEVRLAARIEDAYRAVISSQ